MMLSLIDLPFIPSKLEAGATVEIIILFIVLWTHGHGLIKINSFEKNRTTVLSLDKTSRSYMIHFIRVRIFLR